MNSEGLSGENLRAAAANVQSRMSSKLGDVWWFFLLRGIFAAALGICALIWPSVSLAVLLRLVGLYCLVDGIAGLIGSLRSSERSSLLHALFGLAVGIVLLVWPGVSSRSLMILFGAWSLFVGVNQLIASRRALTDEALGGVRKTVGIIAVILGLVLLIWPGVGVVTVAWIIGIVALLIAALLIYLATRVKSLKGHVDSLTDARDEA